MFDSHCHLHEQDVLPQAGELVDEARKLGVRGFLLAGVDPSGWRDEHALVTAHSDVWASYGVHPQVVAEQSASETLSAIAELERIWTSEELVRPVAIGEIGLDLATLERKACLALQERIFREQLAFARNFELPVVLHVRDAQKRVLEILKRDGVPRAAGIMHSYSGPAELVREYLKLGLYIAFAGTITSERAKKTRRAALAVPESRLLVETDAPFQTPQAYRPERNRPAFLPAIVKVLAELRREAPEDVARYTEENARRVLGLPAG